MRNFNTLLITAVSIFIVSGCGSSKPPPRPPAPRVPPPPVTSSVPVVSGVKIRRQHCLFLLGVYQKNGMLIDPLLKIDSMVLERGKQ